MRRFHYLGLDLVEHGLQVVSDGAGVLGGGGLALVDLAQVLESLHVHELLWLLGLEFAQERHVVKSRVVDIFGLQRFHLGLRTIQLQHRHALTKLTACHMAVVMSKERWRKGL